MVRSRNTIYSLLVGFGISMLFLDPAHAVRLSR
jgi:hypothetical protein